MIDFAINDIGDLVLAEQEQFYPKYKIKFTMAEKYPKMKINFKARSYRQTHNPRTLKINFVTETSLKEYNKHLVVVKEENEKSQSIAIRLKTELGELQNFFSDFGSELTKIRHSDLQLTSSKINTIIEYVENAVYDIIPSEDIVVDVEKSDIDPGNFKLETLKITIKDKSEKLLYSYSI